MATKDKSTNIEVGILVVQPTKNGIEEIAHKKLKVPYLTKSINKKSKQSQTTKSTIQKVSKPKTKKITVKTKDKSDRVEE